MKTIIEMAQEAGLGHITVNVWSEYLERFAALVRADEREACAKVADGFIGADPIAEAIRARGQA